MNLETIFNNKRILSCDYSELDIGQRKLYFLATCLSLKADVDIHQLNDLCPYGGLIGVGNSQLEKIFGGSKILRMHAMIHDACGFMKFNYGEGPGYCYMIPNAPDWMNKCVLGHVTGVLYCLYLKTFQNCSFNKIDI